MESKGNIQMMENVFVVFMLIFIGMLVMIFIGVNSIMSHRMDTQAQFEMEAMRIARSLQNLPELQCTISDETIPYCIDMRKADAYRQIVNHDATLKEHYFPILYRSTINITIIESGNYAVPYENPLGVSYQAFHIPVLVMEDDYLSSLGYIRVEVPR